jgi:hypothetical protein
VTASPRILDSGWGSIVAADVGELRDAKLWPGGGRAWDWNETGTHHVPGIQPADLEEVLDHGASVVVLSRGRDVRLLTPETTMEWLAVLGVEVHVHETGAAIDRYNSLVDRGASVGGLFHTTC